MRHVGTIMGAGVLLLLATACAGSDNDRVEPGSGQSLPIGTSTTSTTPPGQPAQTPPAGAPAIPAARIDATTLPAGYPRMAWTQDDGRTVGLVAQEGGCGKASAEVAEQSGARVVIALVETQPSTPQACTMDIRYPSVSVSLDAPLAERTVVLKAEQRKS